MRPFDDLAGLEPDYSDVALLLASARDWPSEDFARELDARVARRFAPSSAGRVVRGRLPRWAAGPAVALVAGVVAAVVVLSDGNADRVVNHAVYNSAALGAKRPPVQAGPPVVVHGGSSQATSTAGFGVASSAVSAGTPVAPGSRQIRSAQIVLTTPNQHVDQVASEVFTVVGGEHGSVLSSHITTATSGSGGGYASFSLSIPTNHLQDA